MVPRDIGCIYQGIVGLGYVSIAILVSPGCCRYPLALQGPILPDAPWEVTTFNSSMLMVLGIACLRILPQLQVHPLPSLSPYSWLSLISSLECYYIPVYHW